MEKVIIVESPSKSKTIEGYLGKDYTVLSSVGHIRNLATSGKGNLGIDIENDFKPTYVNVRGKSKLIAQLKKECKNKEVYLATDPDREGEAISYHLATVLGLSFDDNNRIVFHEVTKPAILNALENTRKIDLDLVNSQETRRMLDRIIGFKVSKLLQSRIKSKSAGRVQSVALKLVCDLEREILAFVPEAYYEMFAYKDNMKLSLKTYKDQKVAKIEDKNLALEIKNSLGEKFFLQDVKTRNISRESKPPFTTSTLQQDASNKLNFQSKRTMRIAQSLYEGKEIQNEHVGLITYMRTDSTRLSPLFTSTAHEFIEKQYGNEYLGHIKNQTQKLAQDAHEGIRPTSIYRTPSNVKKYLSDEELKLYSLIWKRAVASLMSPAKLLGTTYVFANNDTTWNATGQELLFDGYLRVYGLSEEDKNNLLPKYNLTDSFVADKVELLEEFTKPKSRYTEATLIKKMEDSGIGRPSTYASTMSTLTERGYVSVDKKKLVPTEQGMLTSEVLDKHFSNIFNVDYTANMEQELDKISNGEEKELNVLRNFYSDFITTYDKANVEMKKIPPKKTGEKCPKCGSDLVIRKSRYGEFVACSNYPECKYIKDEEDTNIDTGIACPNCKDGHIIEKVAKKGRNKGNKFYSCSNYPKCKTIYNDKPLDKKCPKCGALMLVNSDGVEYCSKHCEEPREYEDVICDKCHTGHFVKKVARRGKNAGKVFYACSNYPKCKNAYSHEPTNKKCELCGSILLKDGDDLICSNKECDNYKE